MGLQYQRVRFHQRNHRLHYRVTIPYQSRMPLSSGILRQQRRTGSKPMFAYIAKSAVLVWMIADVLR